ncbi:MAG: DUF58 domain-containing protein [Verrucomicrobia bacterium]|nr:DUF58 domain-containing protein [Verrucomicrobiota bacterium]
MLAPRARLLFWFAALAGPSSLLPVLSPEEAGWALVGPMALAVLAAWDATLVLGTLKRSRVEAVTTTRCAQGRASFVPLKMTAERARADRVILSVALPAELRSHEEAVMVPLPASREPLQVEWAFTPRSRGHFTAREARLCVASPLGFWTHWVQHAISAEIRCYPNLSEDRRKVAALFLNRGGLGMHTQRQVGQGREFEKLREYLPGDGYDEIHWKATAKRGQPVTKVYQIERTQEVYVMVDVSRLSARMVPAGTSPSIPAPEQKNETDEVAAEEPMLERCLSAALVLGQAAEHQGDLFGLTVFGERVEKFIRAGTGVGHFHACRDALYRLSSTDTSPDFEELASFVRSRLRRRAMLLYLTSLDDPILAESFLRHAQLLSRQHLMIVFMIQPNGVRPLFADESAESIDSIYEDLGGHLRWHSLREQKRQLQQWGITFNVVAPGTLAVDMIRRYAEAKNRQLL